MSVREFDDSASACAIDALSIICKRSTANSEAFYEIGNDEVDSIYSIVQSGEASRNDLEDASSSNVLWCSVVLLLKPNIYFAGKEDISTVTSNLPVHVQRLLGALFSTFELLMDHQRSNHAYLVASIVQCVGQDAFNVQNLVIQMTKDYKSMFSYAYMFNRRTGTHPVSQVQQVLDYFEQAAQQQRQLTQDDSNVSDRVVNLDEDDDNDSYERLMRSNTNSHFNAPKFGAPIVMPLRPVKLLSDDEHYGSDYQPAIASDLETDLTYDSQRRHESSQHGQLQDDSIFSMDGGSILNSYYKYNGWNNAVEEDEDSDTDHYAPPVVEPVRPKRMTRMRQQATSRSIDNHEIGSESKMRGVRTKKKGKKTKTKKSIGLTNDSGGQMGSNSAKVNADDSRAKLPWASMGNKGLLSDDSDASNDDEESDFSESETLQIHNQQAQSTKQTYYPAGISVVAEAPSPPHRFANRPPQPAAPYTEQKHTDEVEDFEMDEDEAFLTGRSGPARNAAAAVSVPVTYNNSRQESDAYSPANSGNSSFELSDREKRHRDESKNRSEESSSSRANSTSSRHGWRSADQRAETSSWPNKGTGGGRIRSVLSDDESEEEEVVTSARLLHAPAPLTNRAVPVRNPLDASIETQGFGVYDNKSDKLFGRNPLDQSIEVPRGGMNVSRNSSDWGGKSNTTVVANEQSERVFSDHVARVVHSTAPSPSRSVVRLPTAKPTSKPTSTEGLSVDLVEDWDSQLSDEEPVVSRKNAPSSSSSMVTSSGVVGSSAHSKSTSPPVAVLQPKATPPVIVAPQPERYEHTHEHREAPHHKLSQDLTVPPMEPPRQTRHTAQVKDSPEKIETDDRKAGLERMRENILRSKREKVRATGRYAGTPADDLPVEVENRRYPGHSNNNNREISLQPPSILRKSVTFSDQQSREVVPVVPSAPPARPVGPSVAVVKVNGRYTIEDSDEARESLDAPQVPQLNSHHEKHTHVATPAHVLVFPDHRNEVLNVPHVAHAPDTIPRKGLSLDLPPSQKPTPKREESSPKLPPARVHTTQIQAGSKDHSVPVVLPNPVLAPPQPTAHAPSSLVPTLSRTPSEQLLPTRAPIHPFTLSRNDSARDSHVSVSSSRQFSSSNLSVHSSISRPVLTLPETFTPPPLSEFALNSGIILEGYLHKKSGTFGLWQKRYFVLSESTTSFCVLRIFSRAVQSAWGPVAVGLKASIPIHSIEAVESVAAPAAKGKEFTIKFHPRVSKESISASSKDSASRAADGDNVSDAGSEFSDSMFAMGGTKLTTLLAEDAETRLLWVTMLTKVLAISLDAM